MDNRQHYHYLPSHIVISEITPRRICLKLIFIIKIIQITDKLILLPSVLLRVGNHPIDIKPINQYAKICDNMNRKDCKRFDGIIYIIASSRVFPREHHTTSTMPRNFGNQFIKYTNFQYCYVQRSSQIDTRLD